VLDRSPGQDSPRSSPLHVSAWRARPAVDFSHRSFAFTSQVFPRDNLSPCRLTAGKANAPRHAIPLRENDESCPRLSLWPYCRLR
jgi:hypothetical protein